MVYYATYPCKNMRITQGYEGSASHIRHYNATKREYALDEGGKDTKKTEWFYAPFDLEVFRVYTSGTNTIFLRSQHKIKCPNGIEDHICMLVTHPDSFGGYKKGSKVPKGTKMFQEGNDGTSGYHFHFAVGTGSFVGTGWAKDSKTGAWVINVTGKSYPLEAIFYIDESFTSVISSNGYDWQTLPPAIFGQKYRTTARLNLRTTAGANSSSTIIITMPINTLITEIGAYQSVGGVAWRHVSCTVNGKKYSGWCNGNFLKRD